MVKTLYLVRHAESESNAGYPTSDFANIQLSETGHAQAKNFALQSTLFPDLVVISPYLRATQSARYFSDLRPHVAVEQWAVQEFVNVTFGAFPPTTRLQRKPIVDEYWLRSDPLEKHVGGESFVEFWTRVTTFWKLVQEHPANLIIVFTHGFFIQAFDFGFAHHFPTCNARIMVQLRAQSLTIPCDNMSVREFRLPPT